MTDRLIQILFAITEVLLGPVLVLLVALFVATLWMLGGLAREWLDRWRCRKAWGGFLERLRSGHSEFLLSDLEPLPLPEYPALFRRRMRDGNGNGVGTHERIRKLLDDLELDMARRLSRLSYLTRVGPMLGLVGTLLPLGPALRGLASDDLNTLASNLEIAFTSTVFGLLIGGLAHGGSVLRRNWYDQDLSDLEFLMAVGEDAWVPEPAHV